jgi:hypothetical protein
MAKERSKKSTYPSRYGGGYVTIAQYITEYLCENIAKNKGKELPQQFWELEEWSKFYKTQIVLLNKYIIKKYHPRAVVKALKDFRCKNVNSFGGFLKVPIWKKTLTEMDKLCKYEDDRENNLKITNVINATHSKPIQPQGKKTIFTQLRDLEDGKKD